MEDLVGSNGGYRNAGREVEMWLSSSGFSFPASARSCISSALWRQLRSSSSPPMLWALFNTFSSKAKDFCDTGGATVNFASPSKIRSPVSTCRVVWCKLRTPILLWIFSNACCTLLSLARLFNAFTGRASLEASSEGRVFERQAWTVDICSEMLSMTVLSASATSLGRPPASA